MTMTTTRQASLGAATAGFSCPVCGKSYKTKDSLTRHHHNHENGDQHVCSICSLNFHRRDLLLRHSRIHDSCNKEGAGTNIRRRNRHACTQCRHTKLKCNGQRPCSMCLKGRRTCTYERETRRLSQHSGALPNQQDTRSPPSTSSEVGYQSSQTPTNPQSHSFPTLDDPFAIFGAPVFEPTPISAPDGHISATAELTAGTEVFAAPAPTIGKDVSEAITLEDSSPDALSDLVTWPWLHEKFFLQEEYTFNPDLFNMEDVALTDGPVQNIFDTEVDLPNVQFDAAHEKGAPSPPIAREGFGQDLAGSWKGTSARELGSVQDVVANLLVDNSHYPSPFQHVSNLVPTKNQRFLLRQKIVKDLVDFALESFSEPSTDSMVRSKYWHDMSTRVEEAFSVRGSDSVRRETQHVLHYFLDLYFEHFHELWPLFMKRDFQFDSVPPMLYLTMSVIGSMYSGEGGSCYGLMLHESLRTALVTAPFLYQDSGISPEWLIQSMLITQMTILYYGRKRAFSYAQHLGSILVTEARKINLFGDERYHPRRSSTPRRTTLPHDRSPKRLVHAETRKRLAYGIFRAEVFLSTLLNTPPLVSIDEMNLTLPCSDEIWMGDRSTSEDLRSAINQSQIDSDGMLFSDLVRIAMDRAEVMPDLNIRDRYLVLLGLQAGIWRFAQDLDLFDRMTGSGLFEPPFKPESHADSDLFTSPRTSLDAGVVNGVEGFEPSVRNQDHLDCSLRKMNDLRIDYDRLTSALQKWKHAFTGSQIANHLHQDRNILMSSRLLYHLSCIRLKANIEKLHLICYRANTDHPANQEIIERVHKWSRTEAADKALQHACAIWSLISDELARDEEQRTKFTILCLIGLHHAAVVVWAYAGTHKAPGTKVLDAADAFHGRYAGDLRMHRENTFTLMTRFTIMFRAMTPAWMANSSFSSTTARMSEQPFPLIS